jgi:hypothetical protein
VRSSAISLHMIERQVEGIEATAMSESAAIGNSAVVPAEAGIQVGPAEFAVTAHD